MSPVPSDVEVERMRAAWSGSRRHRPSQAIAEGRQVADAEIQSPLLDASKPGRVPKSAALDRMLAPKPSADPDTTDGDFTDSGRSDTHPLSNITLPMPPNDNLEPSSDGGSTSERSASAPTASKGATSASTLAVPAQAVMFDSELDSGAESGQSLSAALEALRAKTGQRGSGLSPVPTQLSTLREDDDDDDDDDDGSFSDSLSDDSTSFAGPGGDDTAGGSSAVRSSAAATVSDSAGSVIIHDVDDDDEDDDDSDVSGGFVEHDEDDDDNDARDGAQPGSGGAPQSLMAALGSLRAKKQAQVEEEERRKAIVMQWEDDMGGAGSEPVDEGEAAPSETRRKRTVSFADEDEIFMTDVSETESTVSSSSEASIAPPGLVYEVARAALKQGHTFLKHSEKTRPHYRHVSVSADDAFLVWRDPKKPSVVSQIPLDVVSEVRFGLGITKRSFLAKKIEPHAERTFSLVCTNRVIELECETVEVAQYWMDIMQTFITYRRDQLAGAAP